MARKGNIEAGAIAVKVINADRLVAVYIETRDDTGAHQWRSHFDGFVSEEIVDAFLEKEVTFDRDLWIVEVDDKLGRSFLE